MKTDDSGTNRRQTRSQTKAQSKENRKRVKESGTEDIPKGKAKRLKKNSRESERTEEEEKMGNFLSRWLGYPPKNQYRDPDWRQKMNERAEEEAKWEREEKERILRAKALRREPVSDTEDENEGQEDNPPLTLIQQRERDESRAERQKERYDIRKYRLKFHAEGRVQISEEEKAKLEFKTTSRENEDGEWDFTLLPEFRKAYENLILSKREDGEEEIQRRRERFEKEDEMKKLFKQQRSVDRNPANSQQILELESVRVVVTNEINGEVVKDSAAASHPWSNNQNINSGPYSGASTSAAANFSHQMSPSPDSPESMDTDDTLDFYDDDDMFDSQRPRIYRQPSENDDGVESPETESSFWLPPKKDKKNKISKKEQQELERKRQRIEKKRKLKLVSRWSIEDTREYREGYVGKLVIPDIVENKEFYFNERPSIPDGGYIEEILRDWRGNYSKLESHHGYVQWLFPIREKGMNFQSYELQPHEAEAIKNDKDASLRVVRSYEMMLDFYGIRLVDRATGKLERDEHWQSRFTHLNKSFHNYLRITRILKCLGELGYEHYKVPFILFMLEESLVNETLPNCARSCMEYWLHTVRDSKQRSRLITKANKLIDDTTAQAIALL